MPARRPGSSTPASMVSAMPRWMPSSPIDELERACATQTWSPQSSGITIEPKAARILSELWQALPPLKAVGLEPIRSRWSSKREAGVEPDPLWAPG